MAATIDRAQLTRAAATMVHRARSAAARRSLACFCELCMPQVFDVPFAAMHHEIIEALETLEAGQRQAIAAPRWHGKSAIVALAYPLWRALVHKEPHTVVVVPDGQTAADRTVELFQHLVDNPRIAGRLVMRGGVRREGNAVVIEGDRRIAFAPLGARIGARRWRTRKPSLVILDDLEPRPRWDPYDQTQWGNQQKLHRAYREARALDDWIQTWIDRGLEPGARVVAVGSIAAADALLADLVDHDLRPEWKKLATWSVNRFWRNLPHWGEWAKAERVDPAKAAAILDAHGDEMAAAFAMPWPGRFKAMELVELAIAEGDDWFQCQLANWPDMENVGRRPADWKPYDGAWSETTFLFKGEVGARSGVALHPRLDARGPDEPAVLKVREEQEDVWVCRDFFSGDRAIHRPRLISMIQNVLRESAEARRAAGGEV